MFCALLLVGMVPTLADDDRIEAAQARDTRSDWTCSATLLHGDAGWDDYAELWADGRGAGCFEADLSKDRSDTATAVHFHANARNHTGFIRA